MGELARGKSTMGAELGGGPWAPTAVQRFFMWALLKENLHQHRIKGKHYSFAERLDPDKEAMVQVVWAKSCVKDAFFEKAVVLFNPSSCDAYPFFAIRIR